MANKETSKTSEFQMQAGELTSVEMQDRVVAQEAEKANIAPRDSGDLPSDDTPVECKVAGTESQMTELPQAEESSQTSPVLKGDIHPSVESKSNPESDNTPIEFRKLANSDSQAIEQPLTSADTSTPEFERDTQNSVIVPAEAQSSQDEARTTGESEPLIASPSAVDTQASTLESLLQELLSKVSGLESLSETLPTKLQQIENRLIAIETNQHKEIEAPGSKPMPEIEKLVQNACERDKASLNKDEQELNNYYTQVKHWTDRIKTLRGEIISATQVCYDRIKECGKVMKDFLPSRLDLQPRLQGRYESLELIEKMLVRLQKPADALSEDEILDLQLPSLSKQELIDLFDVQMDKNAASQGIEKKLENVGDLRYQRIRKVRGSAEKLRKCSLNFVEKKVLPILDGIDDSKRNSELLVNELKNDNPKLESQLDAWFQTYSDLQKTLLSALQEIEVQCMNVKIGEPIDYNRHEPIDFQEDPKFPNEYIKEVTRHGYEYKDYPKFEFKVLRHAQVIVVKNPNITN